MKDSDNNLGGAVMGIVIGIIIGSSIGPSRGELENSKEEAGIAQAQCEEVKDEYVSALDEANLKIEEANNISSDAGGYAWSSYQDMGYALENLSDVESVDDPEPSCY